MSVYVSGRKKIKKIKNKLRVKYGFTVNGELNDEINTPETSSTTAINEISSSDVFLAIMNDTAYDYRETFTEIGVALALKKSVIIICGGTSIKVPKTKYTHHHYCMTNVFCWHPLVTHVSNLHAAVECLNECLCKEELDSQSLKREEAFNKMKHDLSDQLWSEDRDIIMMYTSIPYGKKENIKTNLQLLNYLENHLQRDEIPYFSSTNVDFIMKILQDRNYLAYKILKTYRDTYIC